MIAVSTHRPRSCWVDQGVGIMLANTLLIITPTTIEVRSAATQTHDLPVTARRFTPA